MKIEEIIWIFILNILSMSLEMGNALKEI